jgi:tetratricopeptide (TPR) repeat protein
MHRAQREARVADALAQGQKLLHEGRYGAVVQLLEPLLQGGQETSLRQLIDYARRLGQAGQQAGQQPGQQAGQQAEAKAGQAAGQQVGTATLRRAELLLAAEFYEEAVAMLESDAASAPSPQLRELLDRARSARDQEVALLARAGKSYASLMDESLPADWLQTRSALQAASPHSVLGTLAAFLDGRVISRANHIASAHIKAARAEIRDRQFQDAERLLSETAVSIQYASPENQAEWGRLCDQVRKETGTSRLRRTLRDTFNG